MQAGQAPTSSQPAHQQRSFANGMHLPNGNRAAPQLQPQPRYSGDTAAPAAGQAGSHTTSATQPSLAALLQQLAPLLQRQQQTGAPYRANGASQQAPSVPSAGGAQPLRQQHLAQPSQTPAWNWVPPAVQPPSMAATTMQPSLAVPRNTITPPAAATVPAVSGMASQSAPHLAGSSAAGPGNLPASHSWAFQAAAASGLQAAGSGSTAAADSQQAAAGRAAVAQLPSWRASNSAAVPALDTSVLARLTASIQQRYPSGRAPTVSESADNGRPDQSPDVNGQLGLP